MNSENGTSAESIEELLMGAEEKMDKSLEALRKELSSIRTGRANSALVDHLLVDYYGSSTPLQSLASVSTPEARLIVIQPFDRSAMQAIEKAISHSELGLTPNNDGQVIRINIPQLTEERRQEYVKVLHKRAEESRVSIRNARSDAQNHMRKLEKDAKVSKDEVERELEHLQKITNRHTEKVDEIAKHKESELLEV